MNLKNLSDEEFTRHIGATLKSAVAPDIGRLQKRVEALERNGGGRPDPQVAIDILEVKKELNNYISANEDEKARAREEGGRIIMSGGRTPGDQVTSDHNGLEMLARTREYALTIHGGFLPEAQAAFTSDSLGYGTAGIVQPQFGGFLAPLTRSRLVLRDVLASRQIESGRFDFVRQTGKSTAGVQPHEGSPKAESEATWEAASAPVKTFATWLTISTQVIEDLTELRRVIDVDLLNAVRELEQEQMLSGDGIDPNLEGLVTAATAFEMGRVQPNDTRLDFLRHAVSQLEEANERPTFCVLSPADFWQIKGLKDQAANEGGYLLPISGDSGTLWLPTVRTTALSSGSFLVGSSDRALILDRTEANVMISFEHSENFVRNLATVRAESRLGLAVFASSGFVKGSFATASP